MGLLGGKLKRMELLSARLGDVLAHLYLASACVWRYRVEKDARACCRWRGRHPCAARRGRQCILARCTPTCPSPLAVWWARWCCAAPRTWRRCAMCSCWNWPNCCATNPRIVKRLCPDLATPAGGGLRDLMDALALAAQLGEETAALNKAVRRTTSRWKRAALLKPA
jgi:acyl-CoA dehydrogenase